MIHHEATKATKDTKDTKKGVMVGCTPTNHSLCFVPFVSFVASW